MQFVRLVNAGDRPYDFHQDNRKRVLGPGEEAMVPWHLATSLFGDPFTTDTSTEAARTRAWTIASGNHNYQGVEIMAKERGITAAQQWDEMRPRIQVYDVETGDRVYMVIEDQDGALQNGQAPAPINEQLNQVFLVQQIADLQKTVSTLVALQMQTAQNSMASGPQVFPSEDAPSDDGLASAFTLPTTVGVAGDDVPPPAAEVIATPVTTGPTPEPIPEPIAKGGMEDIPQTPPTGGTTRLARKVTTSDA